MQSLAALFTDAFKIFFALQLVAQTHIDEARRFAFVD
jgi:hypothetical protein